MHPFEERFFSKFSSRGSKLFLTQLYSCFSQNNLSLLFNSGLIISKNLCLAKNTSGPIGNLYNRRRMVNFQHQLEKY